MAIYHFSAKIISRANGSSALASAAYRSASRLYDERLDRAHDFTNKSGVIHSEVMTPENVPEELRDREKLWNEVGATEKRKDAQLAREVEFAIPRELSKEQGIELARDFVRSEFVDQGMIADLNVHWDVGRDGEAKPHAHVMLTMRSVDENGFGAKVREWNRTERLEHWREAWAEHVNERLAELGIEARIDHRSFEAQGIELEPQHKIGPAAARMAGEGLEPERLEEHREIARENGLRIIADPSTALDAITRNQATFTHRDLAMFVHRHSDGLEQFNAVMGAVEGSQELVRLGQEGRGEDRYTSREMIAVEERLHRAAESLAERERHHVREDHVARAVERAEERELILSREQGSALAHVVEGKDLAIVIGHAGSGKSAMLGVAREAWQEAGYEVRGGALSGIAAENLQNGSGIESRTLASMEHQWAQDRERLGSNHVLVIDEAGMVGSRQLERVLSEAERAGAKVVLVGDAQQLQAIEAGAAFRSLTERERHVEMQEVRRQQEAWQRAATRQLGTGRTEEALEAYRQHDMVREAASREEARAHLIESWNRDRQAEPDKNHLILTHTNDEVAAINALARDQLRAGKELGLEVGVRVERGDRSFASGDRVMFLKNDREMEIKNGSLGAVESVTKQEMKVRLDTGRSVAFDLKDYAHLDHGYAATIHKAQGVTVDRVHVLATPGLDRHAAYVALSRHRDSVKVHYGRDDFADHAKLARILSRERGKDMASDYGQEQDRRAARAKNETERGNERAKRSKPESERSAEPGREAGMFASFQPQQKTPEQQPSGLKETSASHRHEAVQRYARAVLNVWRMEERELPVLPHQQQAVEKARSALDKVGAHVGRDLDSAFGREPKLVREAAEGRMQEVTRAMRTEAEVRANSSLRADRFVASWQKLEKQREASYRSGDVKAEQSIKANMGAMAKGLERDPQVESVLRNRSRELGIAMQRDRTVGQSITAHLGLDRGRELSL